MGSPVIEVEQGGPGDVNPEDTWSSQLYIPRTQYGNVLLILTMGSLGIWFVAPKASYSADVPGSDSVLVVQVTRDWETDSSQ